VTSRCWLRLVALCVLIFAQGCSSKKEKCDDELSEIQGGYEGPVVAFSSGDASFAVGPECGLLMINGTYEDYKVIEAAYENSPLDWFGRPLMVKLRGYPRDSRVNGHAMIFEVEEIVTIVPMNSTDGVNETTMAFHSYVMRNEESNSAVR